MFVGPRIPWKSTHELWRFSSTKWSIILGCLMARGTQGVFFCFFSWPLIQTQCEFIRRQSWFASCRGDVLGISMHKCLTSWCLPSFFGSNQRAVGGDHRPMDPMAFPMWSWWCLEVLYEETAAWNGVEFSSLIWMITGSLGIFFPEMVI